jgi:hypothetical protein
MAKAKSEMKSETVTRNAGTKYKVIEHVRVPTIKIPENTPMALRILQAIQTKQTKVKGEDGVERLKDIDTVRVMDHDTGELGEIVVGAALGNILRDYGGGNGAYVGLDFLIEKGATQEGKRYKAYTVSRIEVEEPADK